MPRKSAIVVLLAVASGCAGPNAQVTQIQSEKQELLAAVKVQKDEQEALRQKAASLEQRLDQSEKEIVRLTGRKSTWDEGTRTASTKNSSTNLPLGEGRGEGVTAPKKEVGQAQPAAEKLPWRAPAAIPTKSKPTTTTTPQEPTKSGSTKTSTQATSSLRSLAQRDSRLQYDPATDTARFQTDISFEENGSGLTADGRKRLDDLASWLKAEQTKELRILVSGSTAGAKRPNRDLAAGRASAVVDYLDRHGINADRLAIVESQKPLGETAAGPVQIRLAESSAPILGLVPKQPALRR